MSQSELFAYVIASPDDRLYQGEILSNVVERVVRHAQRTAEGDEFGFDEVVHPYAVLLTQDCDLEQDARVRLRPENERKPTALVHRILLLVASEFETAKGQMFDGGDVRKRAKQNKDERYHFLSAVRGDHDLAGSGIPALVLDFKRYFTYSTDELLGAISRGETLRRARLRTPYAEHLSDRFGYFMQRIGLPRDHHDFGE